MASDLKCLEHPTLKVPYEVLNKKFRVAQKNIDREACHLQNAITDMEKPLGKPDPKKAGSGEGEPLPTNSEVVVMIDKILEKISSFKRKAEESILEEAEVATQCKRRVNHLMEIDMAGEEQMAAWKRKRLDRMLVEHLLRTGHYNTAISLAKYSEIEDLTNVELFLVSKEVEESLMRKETTKCLAWCHDNRSRLRKLKSTLEFDVRMQEFVEMIKADRPLDAIKHARKQFSSLEEDHSEDIKRYMGLLAMSSQTQVEPYRSMLAENRWKYLVDQFRTENQRLYQMSNQSVFSVALQAGLSALKTPHCYKKGVESRKPDCPICQEPLKALAEPLPYALRARSKLICYISGTALNEHNQPLMLPNGHVYGELALQQMACESEEGRVVCPRTQEKFLLKECEKIFVM